MTSDIEIRMCSTLICTQNTVKTTRSKEIWGGEDKQIDGQGQLYEQNTSEINVTDVNRSLRQEKDNKIDSPTRLHAFLFDQSCLILIWERASFNLCTTFSTISSLLIGSFLSLIWLVPYFYWQIDTLPTWTMLASKGRSESGKNGRRVTFILWNSVRSYSPQRPQISSTSLSLDSPLGNLHNHVKIFKFERGMLISRIFSRLHILLFDLKLLEWLRHRSAYVKDRHCAEWDGSSSHRFLLYDH